jgi:hypothetical protein
MAWLTASGFAGAIPTTAWSSATSANWNPGDWTNGIPGVTTATTISATGSAYTVTLSTGQSVGTLFLDSANATLALQGGYLYLQANGGSSSFALGNVTLAGGSQIQGNASASGETLSNAATVTSASGTNYVYSSGGVGNGLSFVNSGTVSVSGGTLYLGLGSGDSVSNSGLISVNGGTLYLDGGTSSFANTGTLTVSGGGTVFLGGNLTTAGLGGTINASGGTLDLTGTLVNTSQTLEPPASGVYALDGGKIVGGTVDNTGSNPALDFTGSGGTLSGVAMNGNFNVATGQTFTSQNGTVFSAGTTTFANNYAYVNGTAGTALTIASNAAWTGNVQLQATVANVGFVNNGAFTNTSSTNYIYGGSNSGFSITNTGTMSATAGALNIGYGGTDAVSNSGTINANGGNVTVAGATGNTLANTGLMEATGSSSTLTVGGGTSTWSNTGGTIKALSGGTVDLGGTFSDTTLTGGTISGGAGTLNLTGTLTIAPADTLSAPSSGIYTLDGGTISGGTVSGANNALQFSTSGGTLSGVAMNGNFAFPTGTTATFRANTTFSGGTTTWGNNYAYLAGSPGTALTIASGAGWSGDVQIQATAVNLGLAVNGTLTNTSGSNYVYGGGNSGFTVTNTGTISATAGTLVVGYGGSDTVTNSGTIEADGGNVGVGTNGSTVTSSGTLEALGSASTLTVGGPGTSWSSTGTIEAVSGGTVVLAGAFSDASLTSGLVYGSGSTLDLAGTLSNASGLPTPNSGIYTLYGGTINGGTVSSSALQFSTTGGILNGVSLTTPFTVAQNDVFTVENGTAFGGDMTFGGGNTVNMAGSAGTAIAVGPSRTWTASGYLYVYAQAANLTFSNQGTMNLQGGTIAGAYNSGFAFTNSGTITNTTGSLVFSNYPGDSVTNTGSLQNSAGASGYPSLYVGDGQGSSVTNSSLISNITTGASYVYLYVGGGSSGSVTNSGTIESISTGSGSAVAYVANGTAETLTNTGTIEASGANASLYMSGASSSGTWSNAGGTIEALNGATIYLGGTFSNANLTQGAIDGLGGTLDLTGTLNNTGTLAPPTSGIFTLDGGTIAGGTVDASLNALTFSSQIGTLNGVAMVGNFSLPANAGFSVKNGTTFSGNMTFAGNNYVYMDGPSAGGITLGAGLTWSSPSYLYLYAQAANQTFLNQGTMSLNGGTLAGAYNTGFVFNNQGTVTNASGGLSISNYPGDAVMNSSLIEALSTGSNYSTVYVGDGSGSNVTNTGTLEASTTGTANSTLYIGYGSNATVSNSGLIEAANQSTGSATAYVGYATGVSVANTGTIEATGAGSTVYVGGYNSSGTWTNAGGTIEAVNGGVAILGGTFSNTNLTQGTLNGATGTLDINGTLDNSGVLMAPNSGIFTLDGGTIAGGTVDSSKNALTFSSQGGVLDGVAMVGNFSVPASSGFSVEGATTFSGNVSFGGGNTLYMVGPSGNGITVGSGLTWSDSGYLYAYAQAANQTFLNQGTMTLNGGTLGGGYYAGFLFNNEGTVTNASGGLSISNYPADSVVNSALIEALSAGSNYSTVYVGDGSGSNVSNTGTLEASTTGSGYSTLYVGYAGNATVTNNGTIEAVDTGTGGAAAYLGYSSGTTVANTGLIEASGAGSAVYVAGSSSQGTWSNVGGTIEAAGGGAVYLGGTFSNANLTQGTIEGSGGSLYLTGTLDNTGTLKAPSSGIFTLSGGTILGGTVDASQNALTFSSQGGVLNGVAMVGNFAVPASGDFTISGGTTFGGNMAMGGNNTVYLNGSTGVVLDVAQGLSWTDSGYLYMYAQAAGLEVLNAGTLAVSGGNIAGDYYSGFSLQNTGTLTNTNSGLTIANYPGDGITNTGTIENIATAGNTSSMTLADGTGSLFTNSGTIESVAPANGYTYLYLSYGQNTTFTNTGTVAMDSPGYAYVGSTTGTLTNLSSNALNGGTWIARDGSSVYLQETGSPIATNNATIVLDGANSNLFTLTGASSTYQSVDQTLTTNNGTLEVLSGRNFGTSSAHNPIANSGTIELGGGTFFSTTLANAPGSALTGSGTFNTATGGVTIGNGVLLSPGSGASGGFTGTLAFNTTLTLGSGGSTTFDLVNASPATAGTDYDTTNVTGALTVSATSLAPFTVSLASINPGTGAPGLASFDPTQSYQWNLFSAGSISGFSASDFTLNWSSFDNSLGTGHFFVAENGNDITLNFSPVPEPSTWALMACGAAALGLLALRRRRARA